MKAAKNNDKNILFDFNLVSLLTIIIACLSLYLSYKSFQITKTEKGLDVEPKINFKLNMWNNGDANVSVKNTSNIPISISSIYFLHYAIDTKARKLYYDDILFPFSHSYDEVKPYSVKDTLFKSFVDFENSIGSNIGSIKGSEINTSIIEARIFYSKRFDGKIYGCRAFYTYVDNIVLLNEKDVEESIKTLKESIAIQTESRHGIEFDKKNLEFLTQKLYFINRLKQKSFYNDSLKTEFFDKKPPSVVDIEPNYDKTHDISF